MRRWLGGLVVVALLACAPVAGASAPVFTQTPQSPYAGSGSSPTASFATGDFDGDGRPDLFVGDSDGTYRVLRGVGDGTFQPVPAVGPFPRTGGRYPFLIAVGRFNGDRLDDVALTHLNSPGLTVLLATGGGSFSAAPGSPIGTSNGRGVAAGELNGDDRTDLAWIDDRGAFTVLLGDGSGGFTAAPGPLTFTVGDYVMSVGHLDAGPSLDIALDAERPAGVRVLLNDGRGVFTQLAGSPFPTGTNWGDGPHVADMNGDGLGDVVTSHASNVDNVTSVLLGSASGALSPVAGSPFAAGVIGPYTTVQPALLSGDGNLDVVATGTQSRQLTILQGDGAGHLSAMPGMPLATPLASPQNSAIADFDGDGRNDVAYTVANVANSVFVLLAHAAAAADRTAMRFAATDPGKASDGETLQVTNAATFPIAFGTATIAGPNAGDFDRSNDSCSGRTLAAGAGCEVRVRFLPTASGARSATLALPQDQDVIRVALSGTGTGSTNPPAVPPPTLTRFDISNAVFAAVARGGRASAARRRRHAPKRGTTFQAMVANATRVVIAIERAQPGRRAGGRCARPTRANRRGRRCTRFVGAITLSRAVRDGENALPWSGRIGRKAAKPGSYRSTATARANGPTSRARSLSFRIVRG
jgi:hypothetical protein